MLPQKKRLNRQEFNRFFSVGTRFHSPSFMLIYSPDTVFHASAVASKKIWKTAVERNKFRRRVYDVLRKYEAENSTQGAYIFIAKKPAEHATYADLKNEMSELVLKSKRIG